MNRDFSMRRAVVAVIATMIAACSPDSGAARDDADMTSAAATDSSPVACGPRGESTPEAKTAVSCKLWVGSLDVALTRDPGSNDLQATNGDFKALVTSFSSDKPNDFSVFWASVSTFSGTVAEMRGAGSTELLAEIDRRSGFVSPRAVVHYLNHDRTDEVSLVCTPK